MAERPGPHGAAARAQLEGPETPVALAYLWRWFGALDGMRSYHMTGPNAITAESIRSADALYGWDLTRLEIDAIRVLDSVVRYPDADDEADEEPVADEPLPWPTRKE